MKLRIGGIARRLMIFLMLFVLLSGQALAASKACYINTNTRIYQKASTSSKSLKVKKNLSVTMTAYKGSWARIKRGDNVAYIPLKYLTLKDRLGWYITQNTVLYKSASTSSKKLNSLPKGQKVYVVGRDGSFFRVENSSGSVSGYVRSSYVSSKKPATPVKKEEPPKKEENNSGSSVPQYSPGMSSSEKINFICKLAESLEGKPYSSKANPPSSFDCSRFVRYCFSQADITLEATAKNQGYDGSYTKISSISNLKKGDVVCFDTNSSDGDLSDHTGIYIGNGKFVHASSSAGKVVTSTLSSGYYKGTFSWARRIIG